MNTLNKSLLYATVIENDGRIGKQFTVLGSALVVGLGSIIGAALIYFIIPTVFSFLQ